LIAHKHEVTIVNPGAIHRVAMDLVKVVAVRAACDRAGDWNLVDDVFFGKNR
jgi:hypothetical protein